MHLHDNGWYVNSVDRGTLVVFGVVLESVYSK